MSIARAAAMPNRSRLTALAMTSEDRPAGNYAAIMIALLLGTCANARADAIARSGTVLWRADRGGLHRSEDEGRSWHTVLRAEEDDDTDDELGGCAHVTTRGAQVAAWCGDRVFTSQDGGRRFTEGPATRVPKRERLRRDGRWATRFDDGGAWISGDGGVTWRELPDATAYDLIDVI